MLVGKVRKAFGHQVFLNESLDIMVSYLNLGFKKLGVIGNVLIVHLYKSKVIHI